ncbi:MAG: tol-pal system protein YbgF [Nitrospirae bacterium]|nr:tol-pal system protein YbgF [Nitrospirota bacterium]
MRQAGSFPLSALIGLSLLPLVHAGCAKHADFVELRDDLHKVARAQDQAHKQQQEMLRRLHALEGAKEPGGLSSRIDELAARLQVLEARLAREETQPSPPAASQKPESAPGELARQSKPAILPPPPERGPIMPGTPDVTPTSAYNLAYNDYLNGRYELAISGFQRFLKDFSATSLAPHAQYWLGESHYSMKDYVRAMQAFEQVLNEYPRSEKVPPALYKLGVAAVESGDSIRARKHLKRVIEEFPTSDEARLAKNKLAAIR